MAKSKLQPVLSKNEIKAGAKYVEVTIDVYGNMYLENPFRVIGHPFKRPLSGNSSTDVVRTSYRSDPFSCRRSQIVEYLGDCGVVIDGFDNQHRLFQYTPQVFAQLRTLVRSQDKKAYYRITGLDISRP